MLRFLGMLIATIIYIIVWGMLLCIGFWVGRKMTDKFDLFLTRRVANKHAQNIENETKSSPVVF